ncbi:hypothetical protein BKA64DRAFT_72853 [Cadophora sp. MPI-SDFR-AT-0126]|nr:hypothetical protein BKA64DRAFT_72853 [Leotiomycetes sp. MPI-SDFR-AT-0126]
MSTRSRLFFGFLVGDGRCLLWIAIFVEISSFFLGSFHLADTHERTRKLVARDIRTDTQVGPSDSIICKFEFLIVSIGYVLDKVIVFITAGAVVADLFSTRTSKSHESRLIVDPFSLVRL